MPANLFTAEWPLPLLGRWPALAANLLVSAALSWLLRRFRGRPSELRLRRIVCWGLGGLLLAGAAAGEWHRVVTGTWTVQESLPLHLCDIGLLVVAATLLALGRRITVPRHWQRLYEVAFVWGLGGTLQALLTPDVDDHLLSVNCARYFVLHGGIIVGVLVMTFGLGLRLAPGTPRRVWLITLALAVVMFPVNWLLGANYMYLLGPPAHPSIIDLLGPWPWYLLPLAALATVLILLCYFPFWLARRITAQTPRHRQERGANSE